MIKLIHGNCMELMPSFSDGEFPLVVTDLPYGEVNRKSGGLRNLDKQEADIKTFDEADFVKELIRVCSGSIYIFCGTEQVSILRRTMVEGGLSTRLCIWEKTNPPILNGQHLWLSSIECCIFGRKAKATFNRHCASSVWRFPAGKRDIHPTQKPVKLMTYIIESSSQVGDTVFDPCAGSGSVGIACIRTERNFVGTELNIKYYEKAQKRLSTYKQNNKIFKPASITTFLPDEDI